jgi:hypothetical protein
MIATSERESPSKSLMREISGVRGPHRLQSVSKLPIFNGLKATQSPGLKIPTGGEMQNCGSVV